jgi:hypothetical protein
VVLTGQYDKVLWKIMYFGVLVVPSLFLIFTLQITYRDHWLTARNLLLLAFQPLIALVLVWLDVRFMFDEIEVVQRNGFTVLVISRGPGFWVNTFYSYGIILLALITLGVGFLRAIPFFRRQYLIILIASVIPFAARSLTGTLRGLDDLDGADLIRLEHSLCVCGASSPVHDCTVAAVA